MKQIIIVVVIIAAICAAIIFGIKGFRGFERAALNTQIVEPEPGIHCFVVLGREGPATDCWEAKP